jgi:hypothetical protein
MGGRVVHMGKYRNAYRISIRKPEGNIPFRKPTYRWEDNIKVAKWQVLVNKLMNLQDSYNANIFLTS